MAKDDERARTYTEREREYLSSQIGELRKIVQGMETRIGVQFGELNARMVAMVETQTKSTSRITMLEKTGIEVAVKEKMVYGLAKSAGGSLLSILVSVLAGYAMCSASDTSTPFSQYSLRPPVSITAASVRLCSSPAKR